MHSPEQSGSSDSAAAGPLQPDTGLDPSLLSPDASEPLPLLDVGVLAELEDELAGSGLAQRFARDNLAMWEQRFSKLAEAVASLDREAALDAAISLKVSSTMVGGIRLAKLAEVLEALVRRGDFPRGLVVVDSIAVTGGKTVSELRAILDASGG